MIKTRCLKGIALKDMLFLLGSHCLTICFGHYDWHTCIIADRGTYSIILIRLGYDMNTRSIRPCAIRWDLILYGHDRHISGDAIFDDLIAWLDTITYYIRSSKIVQIEFPIKTWSDLNIATHVLIWAACVRVLCWDRAY